MPRQGPNTTKRIIDVPADTAAPVAIYATGPTRAWSIRESMVSSADATLTAEGFTVLIPNDGTADGFTTKFVRPAYSTTNEPGMFPEFENWNRCSEYGPHGEVFGAPGGASGAGIGTTTATLLAKVGSLTATATSIEITEYF